jgi:hypothetical protein
MNFIRLVWTVVEMYAVSADWSTCSRTDARGNVRLMRCHYMYIVKTVLANGTATALNKLSKRWRNSHILNQ